jgi:hypothetical protein
MRQDLDLLVLQAAFSAAHSRCLSSDNENAYLAHYVR